MKRAILLFNFFLLLVIDFMQLSFLVLQNLFMNNQIKFLVTRAASTICFSSFSCSCTMWSSIEYSMWSCIKYLIREIIFGHVGVDRKTNPVIGYRQSATSSVQWPRKIVSESSWHVKSNSSIIALYKGTLIRTVHWWVIKLYYGHTCLQANCRNSWFSSLYCFGLHL